MEGGKQVSKVEAETKQKIYDEIKKQTSFSLQKKLLKIQHENEERHKIQNDNYEAEFIDLKAKYDAEYAKLYEQITGIVSGETNLDLINLDQADFEKYKIEKNTISSEIGIPNYWGRVLKNAIHTFTVNVKDEKILIHLKEVKLINLSDKVSFTVEFHFTENEYFTNTVLFKTYIFSAKDHELEKLEKSPVNWRSEKMIPNKIVQTQSKKGKKHAKNSEEKEVATFFNIFKANDWDNDPEALIEEAEEADFFRENLIPFSAEYYLNLIDVDCFEGDSIES